MHRNDRFRRIAGRRHARARHRPKTAVDSHAHTANARERQEKPEETEKSRHNRQPVALCNRFTYFGGEKCAVTAFKDLLSSQEASRDCLVPYRIAFGPQGLARSGTGATNINAV